MRKLCGSKVRRYAAFLIDLNENLAFFTGAKLYDKIGVMELNENFLNSMPNIWIKQVHVQGFTASILLLRKQLSCFIVQRFCNLSMKM